MSKTYYIVNTSGTTDGSDAAGAILLSAVAGGIGLAWQIVKIYGLKVDGLLLPLMKITLIVLNFTLKVVKLLIVNDEGTNPR